MSNLESDMLSDMFLEAEIQLDSSITRIDNLEAKLTALEKRIEKIENAPAITKPSAITTLISKGKKMLNITVTGRDADERIQSIKIEN